MITFVNWISTPENRSAFLAIQAVLDDLCSANEKRQCNPVFLHGAAGTGKTHLISALANELTQRRPDIVVQSVPAGDLQQMLRTDDETPPDSVLKELKQADLLIVEDLQHLGEYAIDPLTQIINARQPRQRQMIFTALHGPAQLNKLPARLSSRLASGLVVGLLPLSPLSRRQFLQKRAERRKLSLTDEVLQWLANHVGGSARELDGALSRVETLSRANLKPMSIEELANAFAEDTEIRRLTVDRIAQQVSRYFKLETKQLQARSRAKHVLLPRQLGMYLARELTQLSLKQIGDYFGGRDHTTVLHACRKVEEALQKDVSLSGVVQQLQANLV